MFGGKSAMMSITQVGMGLANGRQAFQTKSGEAQLTKNFYHGNLHGGEFNRAETRKYLDKAYRTTPDSAKRVTWLAELRKKDGTRLKFMKSGLKVSGGTASMDTWDPDPTVGLIDSYSGFSNSIVPDWCQGFDRIYLADAANWAFSTVNGFFALTPAFLPDGPPVLAESGTVTGFGTGDFEYCYTLYASTEGWESRASTTATITKTVTDDGVTIADPADSHLTGIYNRYRIYRRLQNNFSWYVLGDYATSDFPVQDNTPDVLFNDSALSEIHDNETGLTDYQVPPVFSTVAFYRGRLFGAAGETVYWSKPELPFLFKQNEISQKILGDDGDPIIALRVINESLVAFKKHSIWVLNGDTVEEQFVWFPATRNIGAGACQTVVPIPAGCIFLGTDKHIYFFDLSGDSVKTPITHSTKLTIDWTTSTHFCGGYDPVSRHCFLSFSTGTVYDQLGSTLVNDQTYTIAVDGYAVGTMDYGSIYPSAYGQAMDLSGTIKLVIGSGQSFSFWTETALLGDGVYSSNKVTGYITSVQSTTVIYTNATFTDTAVLVGLCLFIETTTGVQFYEISANTTGGHITVLGGTYSFGSNVQAGQRWWIGAIDAVLWFGLMKGEGDFQAVGDITFYFDKSSTICRFGCSTDINNVKTDYVLAPMTAGKYVFSAKKRAYGLAPFIEAIGTSLSVVFGGVEYNPMPVRGPR